MCSRRMYLVAMIIGAYCHVGTGDQWMPAKPQEYASDNGKYVLKVTPKQGEKLTVGRCHAELLDVQPDKSRKSLWTRMLINDDAPVGAYVADSGEYVVTMNEWGHIGGLPVVIYGEKGRLVNVLSLRDLGVENDVHVKQTISSYWWNENSIAYFGASYDKYSFDAFFIRLYWGKMLVINLRTGGVVDDDWLPKHPMLKDVEKQWKDFEKQLMADGEKLGGKRVLAMLEQRLGKKGDWIIGLGPIIAAGQMKLKDAMPFLHELLRSDATYNQYVGEEPGVKVYYVRKAAKEALEALGEETKGVIIEEKLDRR